MLLLSLLIVRIGVARGEVTLKDKMKSNPTIFRIFRSISYIPIVKQKTLSKKVAETFAPTNSFGAFGGHVSTFCSKVSGDKGVRAIDFFRIDYDRFLF